ncbi:MAG: polyprenyl diphosphate synthase [Porticoccaceae bacterium]|nr:polyprenyl diphosphate synthase [Porticoccaceae bacterium]
MTLVTLFGAYLITSMALVLLRPFATVTGLMDYPGGRKTHSNPTPLIGGLGIYLGLLSVSILSPVLMADYKNLLILSGFVLLIGVLDDLYEIRASMRLLCHGSAAWAMAWLANIKLESLGDIVFLGPVELGILAVPVTIFATVGVINAVNMSDGLDGLSGGLVTISLVFLSITALIAGESAVLSFSQLLSVALLAFLTFNFRMLWKQSALLYLGDAGSTLLGFILAWLIIAATQGSNAFIAPVTALWFLAVPLMDTVSLMIKRPLRGSSPFTPGRDHLHHRLLGAGYTSQQTVLVMYGAATVFAAIGLGAHLVGAPDGVMFTAFMSIFAVYFVSTQQPIQDINATETRHKTAKTTGVVHENFGDHTGTTPRHIAVIMDGNNRWARRHGLRPKDGHRRGAEVSRSLIMDCIRLKIPYLTLFAFSSENWLRSKDEVRSLMALFRSIIARDEIADLHEAGARIQFIGNRSNFSRLLQTGMREIERRTAKNTTITVTVALDYGGQWDIAQAVTQYLNQHSADADLSIEQVSQELRSYLSTSDLPDPDLCIRTAGERRLSNFLLWQMAYTELYFSDAYWPDFATQDLELALESYANRERKFGKTAAEAA